MTGWCGRKGCVVATPNREKPKDKKKKKKRHLVHQTASLSNIYAANDMVCLVYKLNFAGLKVIFFAICSNCTSN